jgi:tyrosine aminotransferase
VSRFSNPDHPFTVNDVILSSGCAGAVYNAISTMCEKGENILVARPGFPMFQPFS